MAKQVFESLDLVRHIYSYGPEHREKIARVHESLKNPNAKDLRIENVFIGYHLTLGAMVQYFQLIRCRCCSRHSHHKSYPVITNNVLCFAPPYTPRVPEDKDMHDCKCTCRQQSRIFVKEILTYGA
jgi:hypothetical protein